MEERCAEISATWASGDTRRFYSLIKSLGAHRPGVSEVIKESGGQVITSHFKRIDRWAEHFSAQFTVPPPSSAPSFDNRVDPWPIDDQPPTKDEIHSAIRSLRSHKSPGADGITSELFKFRGNVLLDHLIQLFRVIWEQRKVPSSCS